jgi:hypothetical protein
MSETLADLLIQITSAPTGSGTDETLTTGEGELIEELRRCLRPGAELAVTLDGFTAVTSILWLSDGEQDRGLQLGVRLVGVSAPPGDSAEASVVLCGKA